MKNRYKSVYCLQAPRSGASHRETPDASNAFFMGLSGGWCAIPRVTAIPFIMEEKTMREGKRSKSSELLLILDRVTGLLLLIAALSVTRLGVRILVGW